MGLAKLEFNWELPNVPFLTSQDCWLDGILALPDCSAITEGDGTIAVNDSWVPLILMAIASENEGVCVVGELSRF